MTFMKIFMQIKIYLILVTIQKAFDSVSKKFFCKTKDEFSGKIIKEFVGLK